MGNARTDEDDRHKVCTIKEVQRLITVSRSEACRKIQLLRAVLDKPRPKIVTVAEFREYFDI